MDIEVKMGDLVVTKNPDNLMASGIGSCLVITLYDPKLKIGALAHCMLPFGPKMKNEKRLINSENHNAKYVDEAIDEMLKRMKHSGARREDLEGKLTGGANMFADFDSDIGKENFLSAKEKLKKEGIKIAGESVGGSVGRSVEFSLATGILTVKTKF